MKQQREGVPFKPLCDATGCSIRRVSAEQDAGCFDAQRSKPMPMNTIRSLHWRSPDNHHARIERVGKRPPHAGRVRRVEVLNPVDDHKMLRPKVSEMSRSRFVRREGV